jgi:hypothetical protein
MIYLSSEDLHIENNIYISFIFFLPDLWFDRRVSVVVQRLDMRLSSLTVDRPIGRRIQAKCRNAVFKTTTEIDRMIYT